MVYGDYEILVRMNPPSMWVISGEQHLDHLLFKFMGSRGWRQGTRFCTLDPKASMA